MERATSDDLEALLEVERRSYSHPWTRRNFEGELAAGERGLLLVLRAAGARGGSDRGLRGYCAFQVAAQEMHVMNLAIVPESRRRGLGSFLLRLAMDIAARRGAREAFLEVREGNLAARGLYRSAGFTEAGRRSGYYSRPSEDALVLRRPLGPGPPANHP